MLTRPGLLLVAGGVALIASGLTLGLVELSLLGVAAVVAVGLAVVIVGVRRPRLDVARVATPDRVTAGGAASVRLSVRNDGRTPTPVLLLRDRVGPDADARILVPPLSPRTSVTEEWTLPVRRRGRLRVGPLHAVVVDPFGLAARSRAVAPAVDLIVHPRVVALPALELLGADDRALQGTSRPSRSGSPTFELYGLRDYVRGDDLRQVHWPTSARRGHLMIREDEARPTWRTLVVLDTAGAGSDDVELAVSAAGSVIVSMAAVGHHVRLVTGDGFDSGWGDRSIVVHCLDHLAVHRPAPAPALRPVPAASIVLATAGRSPAPGADLVIEARTAPDLRPAPTRRGHLTIAALSELARAWIALGAGAGAA